MNVWEKNSLKRIAVQKTKQKPMYGYIFPCKRRLASSQECLTPRSRRINSIFSSIVYEICILGMDLVRVDSRIFRNILKNCFLSVGPSARGCCMRNVGAKALPQYGGGADRHVDIMVQSDGLPCKGRLASLQEFCICLAMHCQQGLVTYSSQC